MFSGPALSALPTYNRVFTSKTGLFHVDNVENVPFKNIL